MTKSNNKSHSSKPANKPSFSSCDDLFHMKNGDTCTDQWHNLRQRLHPAQAAVGYAAVQRKYEQDYTTHRKAQAKMNEPGSYLPFVLGPHGVPYLVDSHHTVSALEASGHHSVQVTMTKICDWSHLSREDFDMAMKKENFMMSRNGNGDMIPPTIAALKDDPWRSLAALVRKVKHHHHCPPNNPTCLRGYWRKCQEDGSMIPFFEFRWAYFMKEAFQQGCSTSSYWDDRSDCQRFHQAYSKLVETNVGQSIRDQHVKAWQKAAKLLVPLCRGTTAQTYRLPDDLGPPMGGETLPGRVPQNYQIPTKDPSCAAPKCPTMPPIPNRKRNDMPHHSARSKASCQQ
jgi:hypothetical protein